MSSHSQSIYQPSGSVAGAFRNATMSSHRSQIHEQEPRGAPEQQSADHNAIEPTLANMQSHEPYQIDMSQADERALELQLQAAAATANDEETTATIQGSTEQTTWQRRLGRACDICSRRKVRCDDDVPCKNCIDLGVPCTFVRPAKRRGPANKVAEDLKRARYDQSEQHTSSNGSQPVPVNHSATFVLSMDSIAPFETVYRMIYDFFTYIYPIYPFPHEHLVMERLRKREDVQNTSFCALISSMLAALSALFPHIVQVALAEHEQDDHVLSNEVFVGRCMLVCEQLRGPLTSGRNVDDAVTAFLISLVCQTRAQSAHVEMYLMEALAIVRFLGVERNGDLTDGSPADLVTREMCRRIYWAIEKDARSLQQQGHGLDILPYRRKTQLPPLPLPTDDYYVYVDRIQEQPQGQLSCLEGFILLARIYTLHRSLVPSTHSENDNNKATALKLALSELDTILPGGHPEFASLPNSEAFSTDNLEASQQARMHLRWELQKIMLRSSLISTRFYLANQLIGLGKEAESINKRAYCRCLEELSELMDHVTWSSVAPLAKLILPQLHVGLSVIQNEFPALEMESLQTNKTVEKFQRLLDSF